MKGQYLFFVVLAMFLITCAVIGSPPASSYEPTPTAIPLGYLPPGVTPTTPPARPPTTQEAIEIVENAFLERATQQKPEGMMLPSPLVEVLDVYDRPSPLLDRQFHVIDLRQYHPGLREHRVAVDRESWEIIPFLEILEAERRILAAAGHLADGPVPTPVGAGGPAVSEAADTVLDYVVEQEGISRERLVVEHEWDRDYPDLGRHVHIVAVRDLRERIRHAIAIDQATGEVMPVSALLEEERRLRWERDDS